MHYLLGQSRHFLLSSNYSLGFPSHLVLLHLSRYLHLFICFCIEISPGLFLVSWLLLGGQDSTLGCVTGKADTQPNKLLYSSETTFVILFFLFWYNSKCEKLGKRKSCVCLFCQHKQSGGARLQWGKNSKNIWSWFISDKMPLKIFINKRGSKVAQQLKVHTWCAGFTPTPHEGALRTETWMNGEGILHSVS